jgi:hypothetical protein
MTQIFDPRGNEFTGARDRITNETMTDARAATAVLSALNATAFVDLAGASIVLNDLRSAAFTGTVVFETTVDGVNYSAALGLVGSGAVSLITGAGVVNQQVIVGVTGARQYRIRVSAYTSGTLTVGLRATQADYATFALPVAAPLAVTATAAVNTAVTLTLPAPSAGLHHIITRIEINRFFATAGLAGATPTVVTSTNLPGTMAFSFPTAGIVGSMETRIITPTQPLKSSTAATATTIVCPASTDTIWRVTAIYGVGA